MDKLNNYAIASLYRAFQAEDDRVKKLLPIFL
jgi:hypothetical protein